MISRDIIIACQSLFRVKSFVASGILPALRIEDAKIALYKRLHSATSDNQESAPSLMQSYDVVARYITAHSRSGGSTSTSAASGPDGQSSVEQQFYTGKIPPRPLRLGSYLYYKGVISRSTLRESLVWQKERRALFGQIAMQTGILKTEDFALIMLAVRKGECFGAVARKEGLVSEAAVQSIVEVQKMYNCKIGMFFIKKNAVTVDRLKELEDERLSHNARFGGAPQGHPH
jgi:hypothetical protein